MPLSQYHLRYSTLPDEEIANRVQAKRDELVAVFAKIKPDFRGTTAEIAVLGCGERRFVRAHEEMFSELLGKPVEVITFDITTEHLKGEKGIVEHDCTRPLPNGPFDLTWGHVILKFIETEKQWDVIRNSYDALKPGSVAVHVMDEWDYMTEEERLPDGGWSVPLNRWKEKMRAAGMEFVEVPVKYGLAFGIRKGQ